MPWVIVTRGTAAAGKGAAKGAGKVVNKAGQYAKNGLQKGAKKTADTGRKGARKAGQAGKDRIGPRNARNRAPFGRDAGKLGSSGSGGKAGSKDKGGRGPSGRGDKHGGWTGRAKNAAFGGGGRGRGALPGVGGGDAAAGAGIGDTAAEGTEAARNFARNRWRRRRGPLKKTRTRLNRICLVILTALLGFPLLTGLYGSNAASQQTEAVMAMQCSGAPPQLMQEQTGIPPDALQAYCSAAVKWQIDWAILAAIGNFECDHGRSTLPGCDRKGPHTVNGKGARGPMQFLGATWRSSAGNMDIEVAGDPIPDGQEGPGTGYATDGDDDTVADPWSWRDATHSAARKLLHDGFAEDPTKALLRYNPDPAYGTKVIALADEYRSKIESVRDQEEQPGGGLGGLALGDCPWSPEGKTDHVPVSKNTPATQTMANTLIDCFGRNGRDVYCWSPRKNDLYEHPRGRACDFMMSGGVAGGHERDRGLAMAEWAQAHADELNILYVIWYNRIWFRGKDPAGAQPWSGWRSYGCGGCGATAGHYDHVHVSVKLMPGDPPNAHCPHDSCTE